MFKKALISACNVIGMVSGNCTGLESKVFFLRLYPTTSWLSDMGKKT